MSSTTVHSNNNQVKSRITGMEIIFNQREKKYASQIGKTLDAVVKSHIQEQGARGIALSNGAVNELNKLEKVDGTTVQMVNSDAFKNITKHQEEKAKIFSKAEKISNISEKKTEER